MPLLLIRVDNPPGGEDITIGGYTLAESAEGWDEDLQVERTAPREQELFDLARNAILSKGDPAMSASSAGRALWDLVTGDGIGEWWASTVHAAGGATVRTILDIRVPELEKVPWELMTPAGRAPVFRSDEHPWVRVHKTPWKALDPLPVPITVLVVVGDTSEDLEVDEELAEVHRALRDVPGQWIVEVLVEPSLDRLRRELEVVQPDILHLIAHGMEKGSEHVLAMSVGDAIWPLQTADVDELPRPMPRLVLLNSCRTANATEGQESSWRFADALIERGAAAVISLQGDMPSTAAARFSGTLYHELVCGAAVDVATARARKTVDAQMRASNDQRSWALPSLSVSVDPDRVLPVNLALADAERVGIPPFSESFATVCGHVDRARERRRLWRTLDPDHHPDESAGRPGGGLVVVTGPRDVGKSAVVVSALQTLRLRGRNVVYVDFAAETSEANLIESRKASWLTVLRVIRDSVWKWVPEIPDGPRLRFGHELSFLKRHREPEPWRPPSGSNPAIDLDDGVEFPSDAEDYAEWIKKIFESFVRMLDDAANLEPLLIVLDGLRDAFNDDVEKYLSPYLLEQVGRRSKTAVKLVVVGTTEELRCLSAEADRLAGQRQTIERFSKSELTRLAREFLARMDESIDDPAWEGLWESLKLQFARAPEAGWEPPLFKLVVSTQVMVAAQSRSVS